MNANSLAERIKEDNRELARLERKLEETKREVADIERDITKVRGNLSIHQAELDQANEEAAKTPKEEKK